MVSTSHYLQAWKGDKSKTPPGTSNMACWKPWTIEIGDFPSDWNSIQKPGIVHCHIWLPEGIPIKIPSNHHHFPMVYLWFSSVPPGSSNIAGKSRNRTQWWTATWTAGSIKGARSWNINKGFTEETQWDTNKSQMIIKLCVYLCLYYICIYDYIYIYMSVCIYILYI